MRTKKTMIGYKALTEEYKGIHGTDFSIHSVHELPDTVPQAGKHGLTFALTLHRLFECFDTEKLPIVVEVCAYSDTHIGRHLCATNHMVITRALGYHEIQEILDKETREASESEEEEGWLLEELDKRAVQVLDNDRPTCALSGDFEEKEEEPETEDKEGQTIPPQSIPEPTPSKKSKKKDKPFVHRIPIHFLAMVIRYPRSFAEAVRVKHNMRKNGKAKS